MDEHTECSDSPGNLHRFSICFTSVGSGQEKNLDFTFLNKIIINIVKTINNN